MNHESLFLKSLLTIENPFNTVDEVVRWISELNRSVSINIEKIPFQSMENWIYDNKSHILRHQTGKFFSIEGLAVKRDLDFAIQWSQPIINQPEIGYLGFITKEFNGVLYFLMQAKIEPGNINFVQLSPTLQATKSNYMLTHAGKVPKYLEYFQNVGENEILVDQLQSEQGARFLRKRNRNIIIKINSDIEVYEDFCWLTLGQIKKLILQDNLVNMDSRTVISGISFSQKSLFGNDTMAKLTTSGRELINSSLQNNGKNTMDYLLSWFCALKFKSNLVVDKTPLNMLNDWYITENEIIHKDNKYFKVVGVNVHIENREVKDWCQPLVEPVEHGVCVFLIKKIEGIYHFLVQAKFECGNFDKFELAPTIQCLQSEFLKESIDRACFTEFVINAAKADVIIDTYQSEEGGRFNKEQNRNMLIKVDDSFSEELPENYAWMTLGQLNTFLKFNNFVNIQARSIISALQYINYE